MTAATADLADLVYLQQLVQSRSGIVLSDDKHYLIESRLVPVAREMGLGGVGGIVDRIRISRDGALEAKVIEAMTTNETLWFRDIHPFNALRRRVIPEIMERKRGATDLSVLSAACSSGQEIYSVAMLLEEHFPQLHGWRVDLVGTDLSSAMLAKARAGVYSTLETNRGLPAALLVRYFTQSGAGYQLNESVRRRATFKQVNLTAPWPRRQKFDVIMLRNVLIYFDLPTKKRILSEVAANLAPNGHLFLGCAESTIGVSDLFAAERVEGTTVFRLKGPR